MAYDHEEQAQLDNLKVWWKQYGSLALWILIAVLVAVIAWKSWGTYQARQSQQASALYEELQKAIRGKDQTKVSLAVADVQQKFSGTDYAQMASLLAAKNAIELNDVKTAKQQLVWIKENGKTVEFKALAAIRLAGILLDEKSYDEAMKQLEGDFPAELASSVADRKGDILAAQNDIEGARAAYRLAIEKSTANNPARQFIQMKLDAVGGAPSKVTPTP